MANIDEIRRAIERRLEDLKIEAAALEAAKVTLLEQDEPATQPAAAARLSAARSKPHSPRTRPRASAQRSGSAPARKARQRSTGAPARRASERSRASAGTAQEREPLSADQLEELLRGSKGTSAVAIAKRTGASYERVRAMLERLQTAGRVSSSGNSRTSLWRLLGDEERIAARVAELEAQLASRGRRGESSRRDAATEPEKSGTDTV